MTELEQVYEIGFHDDYDDYEINTLVDLFRFIEIRLRGANKIYEHKDKQNAHLGFTGKYRLDLPGTLSEYLKNDYQDALFWATKMREVEPLLEELPYKTPDNEINLKNLRIWCTTAIRGYKGSSTKACNHSKDFRSVLWFGQEFSFTSKQAACIEMLWKEWEKGTPEISQHTLLVDTECDSLRIVDIFKSCKNFREIIGQGSTKGTWRLIVPQ